jgi:hypothetical protein
MIVPDILFRNMLHVLSQQTPPPSKKYSQQHITQHKIDPETNAIITAADHLYKALGKS